MNHNNSGYALCLCQMNENEHNFNYEAACQQLDMSDLHDQLDKEDV